MIAASSKGIGLSAAQLLAAEGCKVSLCGRNQESLDKAAATITGVEVLTSVVDVTRLEDLENWFQRTVEHLGKPEILVTNTGGPPAGVLDDMTDELWQKGVDSTLMNVIRMVRLAAPYMKESGWGRIVHITSLVAKEPTALLPISSTLRSGLVALTRLQASQLGPSGITVNSVLPGHTLTDRQVHLAEIRSARDGITVDQALELQGKDSAVGRLATPDEIGAPITFLCSQQASFVTGVSLLVDGGSVRGLA